MFSEAMALLRRSWPILGSLYLVYLALQPPPSRWVGLGGLAIVTPLLIGWAAGHLLGVGPWAPNDDGDSSETDLEASEGEPRAAETGGSGDGD